MFRRKLLALPLVLTAFIGIAPAHALNYRICTIPAGGSTFTLTPNSATSGLWRWDFDFRSCIGDQNAPVSGTIQGGYLGVPCVAMVLTGQHSGAIVGGVTGPAVGTLTAVLGGGYYLQESLLVLSFAPGCTTASADAVQVHVVP